MVFLAEFDESKRPHCAVLVGKSCEGTQFACLSLSPFDTRHDAWANLVELETNKCAPSLGYRYVEDGAFRLRAGGWR